MKPETNAPRSITEPSFHGPLTNRFLGQPNSPKELADQLRAAKVEVLRDAASHMSIASDYAILWRMADAIEKVSGLPQPDGD